MSEYKKKMSVAVSNAIMSDPEERRRRSRQMAANNRTAEAREKSRVTAIRTSTRPEIIKARTENLHRWRTNNFDEFYRKCTMACHSTWHSKPEMKLREIVQAIDPRFLSGQRVYDVNITSKSRRKSVDIMNRTTGVVIEFDGKYHFDPIKGIAVLEKTQQRDREFDKAVINQKLTLVRISYDQFSYKDGGRFSDDCLKRLFEYIHDPKPGVHMIGEAYNKNTIVCKAPENSDIVIGECTV